MEVAGVHEAFWTALTGVAVVVLALQFLGLAVALRVAVRMMLRLKSDLWINLTISTLVVTGTVLGTHFGEIHTVFWLQVASGVVSGVVSAIVGSRRAHITRGANQVAHNKMTAELGQTPNATANDLASSSTALTSRSPFGRRVLFMIQSGVGTVAAAAQAVIIVYALLSLADKRDSMPMHLAIWMELGVIVAVPILQTLTADLQMSLKESGITPFLM